MAILPPEEQFSLISTGIDILEVALKLELVLSNENR
jgi:hypothetical protein